MHLLPDRRSFATTVATLHNTFKPDIVIVEPSGVAIPWGLKRAAEYSEEEMEAKIEHAPVVTLVDSVRIDELLNAVPQAGGDPDPRGGHLFINKVDAATPEKIKRCEELIKTGQPRRGDHVRLREERTGGQGDREHHGERVSPRYDEAVEQELLRKQYAEGTVT